MGKLLERLDLAEKEATENFPPAHKIKRVQIWSKLKTVNWTYAKNAKKKKNESRGRSKEGWSLENWSWSKRRSCVCLCVCVCVCVCVCARFFWKKTRAASKFL